MIPPNRFQDENLVLSDFYKEVWIECPVCAKKAIAKSDFEAKTARLFCLHCGFYKVTSVLLDTNATIEMAAHIFFDAPLWLKASFKSEVFYACNDRHLEYLERYITATLREHKDRTHFTLLEKLTKFYHEAKNREGLLKIIEKLKTKS